jgi:hypothetical protein
MKHVELVASLLFAADGYNHIMLQEYKGISFRQSAILLLAINHMFLPRAD